jgi:hypothetical protein
MANKSGLWTPFSIQGCTDDDSSTLSNEPASTNPTGSQRKMLPNSRLSPSSTNSILTSPDHSALPELSDRRGILSRRTSRRAGSVVSTHVAAQEGFVPKGSVCLDVRRRSGRFCSERFCLSRRASPLRKVLFGKVLFVSARLAAQVLMLVA